MSKISTYPSAETPLLLSDRLIGTEAVRTPPTLTPLATKNFSLGELLQLFSSNFPAASLQAVLNTGNTATQNITLTGYIDVTLIKPDNIEDTSGSQGTTFQFLSKGASSINWVNLPVDNLQAVLNSGNTATQSITLIGNITSTRIIPGNIQDDTAGIGTTGQFLSKTALGIRWVNAPTSTTPGLADVLSVGNTATNNITLIGDITATKIIKSGGTSTQYLMADGSVTTGLGTPTLQTVTDAGAVTTNKITVNVSNNLPAIIASNTTGLGLFASSDDFVVGRFNLDTASNNSNIVEFLKNGVLQSYITHNGTIVGNKSLINTTVDNGVDALQINGSLIATSIKKTGGLSTQFLKADGSIDSNTYLTSASNYWTANGNNIVKNNTGNVYFAGDGSGSVPHARYDSTLNAITGSFSNGDFNSNSIGIQQGTDGITMFINNLDTFRGWVQTGRNLTLNTAYSIGFIDFMINSVSKLKLNNNGTLKYATDVSSLYDARTLIDKGYADATYAIPSYLEFNDTDKTVWNNGQGNVGGNTTFGAVSLINNTTGNNNTAIGGASLYSNTTGSENAAIGANNLFNNTTGYYNVAVGFQTLIANTTGNNNIGIGRSTLEALLSGSNNLGIGGVAGLYLTNGSDLNTTSNESIFIGGQSKSSINNQTNQIVIGYNAIGAGSNTVTLGNASITSTRLRGSVLGGSFVKDSGTSSQILAADGSVITAGTNITISGGTISSVGGSGGGGSSVNYYLNGGTSQGTFGGTTYYEFSRTAVIGTGVDFSIGTNGYIASFITDVADPSLLLIPAGNWNLEFFFSSSSAGGSPSFYTELYKYDGTTFTLIASGSAAPEGITNGTSIDAYFTALTVPETVLTVNDRLAIRVFVNTSGKTITLHTQDSHLCEVITTFTSGLTALNGLQAQVQNFATGTTGTDFDIVSSGSTHTFNLPSASATARGVVTTGSQTFAGTKTFTDQLSVDGVGGGVLNFRDSGTLRSFITGNATYFQINNAGTGGYIFKNSTSDNVLTISNSGNATFLGSSTANSFIKLGGTSTQYLMADGSVTTGGGSTKSINSVSTNTAAGSASSTDYFYFASGTINITLPTAVGNTNNYTIKNVGTGVITVNTTSSQTIDGSLTAPIIVQYLSLTIISDGANWNII